MTHIDELDFESFLSCFNYMTCPSCKYQFLFAESLIACPACGYVTDNWIGDEEVETEEKKCSYHYQERIQAIMEELNRLEKDWLEDPTVSSKVYYTLLETIDSLDLCNSVISESQD